MELGKMAHVTVIVVQDGKTSVVVMPMMVDFEMYLLNETPSYRVQELGVRGRPIPDVNGAIYYQIDPDKMQNPSDHNLGRNP